jgi:hypothetical protein
MSDYLDRDGLLALGFDEATVDRLLARSPLRGLDGRQCLAAEELHDELELHDPLGGMDP